MRRHNRARDVLPVHKVHGAPLPDVLFGFAQAGQPGARDAGAAVETGEIQGGAAEGAEFVFGDGALVRGVVGGVVVRVAVWALVEDAGGAELDPVVVGAVDGAVEAGEGLGGAVAGEGEGDEDGAGAGEGFVGFEGAGGGVEFEGDGVVSAGGGGCGVGKLFFFEERDQEGCGPAGAEDEEVDFFGVGAEHSGGWW